MKTRQILSNISYNTEKYLKLKLDYLVSKGDIRFYIYIFHKAENDELKDHFHVILYPDKSIDTAKLDKEFTEIVPDNDIPLGMTKIWKTVNKDCDKHWILYVLHDIVYCKAKCISEKKYHYSKSEFKTNDYLTLEDLVFQAFHETEFFHDLEISKMIIDKNMGASDMIKNGYIPIKQACSYHHFMQMVKGG